MSSNYNKAMAFILLGSALLAQPRIQSGEKMPHMDTTSCVAITYCANLHCWQEKPCLEHQENTNLLPSTVKFPIWPASIIVKSRNQYPSLDRGSNARSLAPLPWSPT